MSKKEIINVDGYCLARVTAPKEVKYMNSQVEYYAFWVDIWQAYEHPSIYKVRVWKYCKRLCAAFDGYNLRITGCNCHSFSAAFEFIHPIDGNLCVAWITKDNNRFCDRVL